MELTKLYWSRTPGKFVNKKTGEDVNFDNGYVFNGTVREWYETLVETIIDACNTVHRRDEFGGPWAAKVCPDITCILMCSVLYKLDTWKFEHVYMGDKNEMKVFDLGIGRVSNITVFEDKELREDVIVGRLVEEEQLITNTDVSPTLVAKRTFKHVATVHVLDMPTM